MSLISDMISAVNAATGPNGGWSIESQPNRMNHETVKEYLDFFATGDVASRFESPATLAAAVEMNTLIELQWYPETAVGFRLYAAADLESLAAWVLRDITSNDEPKVKETT